VRLGTHILQLCIYARVYASHPLSLRKTSTLVTVTTLLMMSSINMNFRGEETGLNISNAFLVPLKVAYFNPLEIINSYVFFYLHIG